MLDAWVQKSSKVKPQYLFLLTKIINIYFYLKHIFITTTSLF